ncbi:Cof-type HAD-IIB family hydrolase, partial [bacterium]|nr:Cof-type HAD-IIB family hydrolase [bacterium]
GIIASDIDRTLTNKEHKIPDEVIAYLEKCYQEGFEIVFLTGRTFSFASKTLDRCTFPFHLGVQNGAEVLKMPEKKFRNQKFLTKKLVLKIAAQANFADKDFVIYSGVELGDYCYYVPANFKGAGESYVNNLKQYGVAHWKEVESFEHMEREVFPMMRLFGPRAEMEALRERVLSVADVTCVILSDVTKEDTCVLMVTEKGVDKGHSLRRLIDHYGWTGCIIGCGDDLNDVSLFDAVDISIGMENGHKELLKKATIIAKPSYNMGIMEALEEAKGMIHDGK